MENGQWLKLVDAAFALGVSEITLRRKIKSGRIPFEFKDGKYFVYVGENPSAPEAITRAPVSNQAPRSPTLTRVTKTSDATRFHDTSSFAPRHLQPTPVTSSSDSARFMYEERISTLEGLLQERDDYIRTLQRQFEDQQTLIAFLEDQIKATPKPSHEPLTVAAPATDSSPKSSRDDFPYRII